MQLDHLLSLVPHMVAKATSAVTDCPEGPAAQVRQESYQGVWPSRE